MTPEILSVPAIALMATGITSWMSGFIPEGRARKALVFLPFVLAIALAALMQLTLSGEVTGAAFVKAFVSGAVAVIMYDVRKAGEKSGPTE